MSQIQLRKHEQILERMINSIIARTNLTDLNDTSVFKHMLAAVAREIDEVYFQLTAMSSFFSIDRADGDDLDERAKDIQPGTLTRLTAQFAIGQVVFSRKGVIGSVVIPAGTIVKTADGKIFRTTAQVQIDSTSPQQISGHGVGRDSSPATTIAQTAGATGNVAVGTIIRFGSKPPGVDDVTNVTAFIQGRDKESDTAFRARLKAFVATLARCTIDALEFYALGVTNSISGKTVIFSHAVEDILDAAKVSLYIDDGAGTAEETFAVVGENLCVNLAGPPVGSAVGGEEYLYSEFKPIRLESALTVTSSTRGVLTSGTHFFVNPTSALFYFAPPLVATEVITLDYTAFTGLIADVQNVIDGDPADRETYPGVRAAGIVVRVLVPTVRQQVVEATLVIKPGFSRADVITACETAVSEYINGLGISGDVVRNELIERIMGVDGVSDLILAVPAANVTLLDDEIPRIQSLNISIV